MKKSMFFGALFAAGMLMTACSSDKDVADNNGPIAENGGDNYIAVSVNLPTEPSSYSRSDANDNDGKVTYSDGLYSEYEVKNASLLIFDNAADPAFIEAYDITSYTEPWTSATASHNVTDNSVKVVLKVKSSIKKNDNLLVILNHNNLIVPQADNTVEVNGAAFTGTYSALQAKLTSTTGLDAAPMTNSGFFMANAPLSDVQGSTATEPSAAKVRVLVPVSNTYKTIGEAESATADQIYVERGMAKVTVGTGTGTFSSAKVAAANDISYTVSAWALDNTNPDSYLIRSTESFNDFRSLITNSSAVTPVYRAIGNTAINYPSEPEYKYRVYFAKSKNYDTDAKSFTNSTPTFELNTFTKAGTDSDGDKIDDNFSTDLGENKPKYCFENTFPVSLQNVNKTTLVQLAVTASYGGSPVNLYTAGGSKSTVYTADKLKTYIQGMAHDYITAQGWVTSGTFNSTDITVGFTNPLTLDANHKVTGGISLSYSGSAVIDAAAFSSGTTFVDAVASNICDRANILEYTKGVSYYSIRIKHFGDGLTPWNNGETTAPSAGTVYPGNNDNNYLGRYGVLRNNWYHLTVSSIKALGDPVPHESYWPGTTDDDFDNYISFQINVLSWAKRTQSADL